MSKAWKEHELAIAKDLGVSRQGPTGKEGPDVLTDDLSVECKYRAQFPAWVSKIVCADNKIGIACVVPQIEMPTAEHFVVVLRWPMFLGIRNGSVEGRAASIVRYQRSVRAKWLTDFLDQVEAGMAPGTTPVVVLHRRRSARSTDIAVVRYSMWPKQWNSLIPGLDNPV